jgi:hypothetical protein
VVLAVFNYSTILALHSVPKFLFISDVDIVKLTVHARDYRVFNIHSSPKHIFAALTLDKLKVKEILGLSSLNYTYSYYLP